MHTYKLRIIETHLDMFGHVNNATYLQIFEEARDGFADNFRFDKGTVVNCAFRQDRAAKRYNGIAFIDPFELAYLHSMGADINSHDQVVL